MMNEKIKAMLIGFGVLVSVVLFFAIVTVTTNNHIINLEEQVNTAKANVSKEEKRRVDLFSNLVDAIESNNTYESGTMTKIVDARNKASNGDVKAAAKSLNVVVERYPELKASENYKQAMKEFSITENRLADNRDNYNQIIKNYNQYVRKFPASLFLNITGYEKQNYKYLDFNVDNAKATNLFEK